MKTLVGLYSPDSGTIEIDGRDITRLRDSERAEVIETIGMLFQQGGLFDSLPIWENIAFMLINRQRLDPTKPLLRLVTRATVSDIVRAIALSGFRYGFSDLGDLGNVDKDP